MALEHDDPSVIYMVRWLHSRPHKYKGRKTLYERCWGYLYEYDTEGKVVHKRPYSKPVGRFNWLFQDNDDIA